MKTANSTLPLFPLRTVLFPGGELGLRIFEPRYLRLVRECAKQQSDFAIALLLEGHEAHASTVTAKVATSARIIDFDTLPDGLLGIRVQGQSRIRLQSVQCQDDGLAVANVEFLADQPSGPVRPEHLILDTLLEHVLIQAGGPHAQASKQTRDDPHWLSYRLAELLPLQDDARQHLLQLDCPHARLDALIAAIPSL
ncbi:MAG: LON peptidase substrate-binding domain-containing protein [Lysobacteraceae bacterium]